MTTSLTNTDLNVNIIKAFAEVYGYKIGVDFDFFCEGDDNIIGYNDDELLDKLIQYYTVLGFQITIEHSGSFHGAVFCKIVFHVTLTHGIVGFRQLD